MQNRGAKEGEREKRERERWKGGRDKKKKTRKDLLALSV